MEQHQKGLDDFIELCISSPNQKTISQLFDFFLTPEEKADLGMRFMLIKELISGKKTQRQIAKDLNISIAKITRGSNELKRAHPKLLAYLQEKMAD